LWQTVKQINSEIAEIHAWLLEDNKVSVVLQEGAPEVEFCAWVVAGKLLLLWLTRQALPRPQCCVFPPQVATRSKRSLKP
jgi:hypothetical protein